MKISNLAIIRKIIRIVMFIPNEIKTYKLRKRINRRVGDRKPKLP